MKKIVTILAVAIALSIGIFGQSNETMFVHTGQQVFEFATSDIDSVRHVIGETENLDSLFIFRDDAVIKRFLLSDVDSVVILRPQIADPPCIYHDTIIYFDTIVQVYHDTITHFDTVVHIHTDTVIHADTVVKIDTIVIFDTITKFDTIVVRVDTIFKTDTIIRFDTILGEHWNAGQLGFASFVTNETWTIGNQIWSNAVQTTFCSNKTTFNGGNANVGYNIDCRSNPNFKGDIFSWRAVNELADKLCPYPWRVPIMQDFANLDRAMGGTGFSRNDLQFVTNNYINRWGGTFAGSASGNALNNQGSQGLYWTYGDRWNPFRFTIEGSISFSWASSGRSSGVTLRCVKNVSNVQQVLARTSASPCVSYDTITHFDTITHICIDTIPLSDTITHIRVDTITHFDSITYIRKDTVFRIDTVFEKDTIFQVDTVIKFTDTIYKIDTIVLVVGVELNQSSATLMVGDTLRLTATVWPKNATNKNIIWSSSDSGIATVIDGKVMVLNDGLVKISATTECGKHADTCHIVVHFVIVPTCNLNTPTWGESLGTVGFVTNNTWAVGNQEWSDEVVATSCQNRFVPTGGSHNNGPNDNVNSGFIASCASRSDTTHYRGDLFTWCAVVRFGHKLCPYPWRVPTKEDFVELTVTLGGTGENRRDGTVMERLRNQWNAYNGRLGTYWNQDYAYWSLSEYSPTHSFVLALISPNFLHHVNPQNVTDKRGLWTLRCVRDYTPPDTTIGCNHGMPGWGKSLGAVSFVTDSTWIVGMQEWSDVVTATNCQKDEFRPAETFFHTADCRSNPMHKGDLFSWCAVHRFGDQLCPYPWRVPTREDFAILFDAFGGVTDGRYGQNANGQFQPRRVLDNFNNYWSRLNLGFWRTSANHYCNTGIANCWWLTRYWSQSNATRTHAYFFFLEPSMINPQHRNDKNYGFPIRCVRDFVPVSGCNPPHFGSLGILDIGTVSFVTNSTWAIGLHEWSDIVQATNCDKITFDAGSTPYYFPDCRTNPNGIGSLFSWCAVQHFANQLCPAPWRMPTEAEFQTLDTDFGGMLSKNFNYPNSEQKSEAFSLRCIRDFVSIGVGCNNNPFDFGTISFISDQTWVVDTVIFSDLVTATNCQKTTFDSGSYWANNWNADCRSNPDGNIKGDLFSLCAVARFGNQLCPSPWRVPTKEEFAFLNQKFGENGGGAMDTTTWHTIGLTLRCVRPNAPNGCNLATPGWGESLGIVGFATDTIWRIEDLEWSDVVTASACNKTTFLGARQGGTLFYADCRSNPWVSNGNLFTWCAVMRFADTLCPYPWRVPTRDEFVALNIALGGTGTGQNGNRETRDKLRNLWGAWHGGAVNWDGSLGNSEPRYWSQTEINWTNAYIKWFCPSGNISPRAAGLKAWGLQLRCVRNP